MTQLKTVHLHLHCTVYETVVYIVFVSDIDRMVKSCMTEKHSMKYKPCKIMIRFRTSKTDVCSR